MRNLLAFLAMGVIVFFAVGWYLDWYKIEKAPSAQGKAGFNVQIDGPKIRKDVSKGLDASKDKVQDFLENADKPRVDDKQRPVTEKDAKAAKPVSSSWFTIEEVQVPDKASP